MRLDYPVDDAAEMPPRATTLIDNFNRSITYLRLAITDRCNLRCRYCMPEQGISPISHTELLRYEELERLVQICLGLGITKFRVTGGEPFVRKGCVDFLDRLKSKIGVNYLYVTTNGVETAAYLPQLQEMGIDGINLSLDTLDRDRFSKITRRDRLEQALATLSGALERGISIKINTVVEEDTPDEDIVALADLARSNLLCIRFIEKMAFSGGGSKPPEKPLLERLQSLFPQMKVIEQQGVSTARIFELPGYIGQIGLIEGYSRDFCTTCNKIRVTPNGMLKTCLYDDGVLNLRKLLRDGVSNDAIAGAIAACVSHRFANGHDTERSLLNHNEPSMATIGG